MGVCAMWSICDIGPVPSALSRLLIHNTRCRRTNARVLASTHVIVHMRTDADGGQVISQTRRYWTEHAYVDPAYCRYNTPFS